MHGKFYIKKVPLQQCLVKEQYTALWKIFKLPFLYWTERWYKNGVSQG
jgi:hypothetical protein